MPDAERIHQEFYDDQYLQCKHCGQHLADPEADTIGEPDVVDGWVDRYAQEWSATVAWQCGYCGRRNETTYGYEYGTEPVPLWP